MGIRIMEVLKDARYETKENCGIQANGSFRHIFARQW